MGRTTPSPSLLLVEEIYRLVSRTRRHLWMAASQALEARGESSFTWQVLCYLVRSGPTSQRDLAYATAQHPAGLSRLIDELEAEGLVTRTAAPTDRRRLLVEATAKGKAWHEASTPEVMASVDEAMSALSPQQRRDLRGLLEQVLGEAEPTAKKAPQTR